MDQTYLVVFAVAALGESLFSASLEAFWQRYRCARSITASSRAPSSPTLRSPEEAVAAGIACNCNTIPLSVVPRAGAIRDTRGVIKMVLDGPTRRVLGVSMLGVNAGEVIHEAAMALRFGATTDDFIDLIHVYPTMAEALKLVALSFTKDVDRLSCCAT
jgi:hypothetical protein